MRLGRGFGVTPIVVLIVAFAVVAAVILAFRSMAGSRVRGMVISTKPSGPETPASAGLAYEEHWIDSGGRRLQAALVRAPAAVPAPPVLLLFQGGRDTISELAPLQRYLHEHGITSFAFDYTGNGNSTGVPTMARLHADGVAALALVRRLTPPDRRIFLWGFSFGSTRALAALAGESRPAVAGVVLMAPYTSLRQIVLDRLKLIPHGLGSVLVPNVGDNRAMLRQVRTPVLIVHSEDDETVPVAHGRALAAAAGRQAHLVTVRGLKHNDCWNPVHEAYWEPVFAFIHRIEEAACSPPCIRQPSS